MSRKSAIVPVMLLCVPLLAPALALADPGGPPQGQDEMRPPQREPTTQTSRAGAFPPPPPTLPPGDARAVYARDGWVVWLARRIDPEDMSHVPGGVLWVWRQRVGDPPTFAGGVAASLRTYEVPLVLEDGTILLVRSRVYYLWIEPDAPIDANEPAAWQQLQITIGQTCRIHAGWTDGVVVVPAEYNESPPVYFVPLRGRELAVAQRVEIVPRGKLPVKHRLNACRTGDEIAVRKWIFDVRTGRRREVPLELKHPSKSGLQVLAFDGELLLCSSQREMVVHDLKTGETRSVKGRYRPSLNSPIALHSRVVYSVSGPSKTLPLSVMGFDLAFPDDPAQAVPSNFVKVGVFEVPPPCAVAPAPDGLHVWAGQRWQRLEWMKSAGAGSPGGD